MRWGRKAKGVVKDSRVTFGVEANSWETEEFFNSEGLNGGTKFPVINRFLDEQINADNRWVKSTPKLRKQKGYHPCCL